MLRPLVTLSDEGVVVAIEQWDRLDSEPLTVFHSGAIIPQMVNAHCHLELSYLRGEIPRGCGFAGFASHLRRVRDAFSREQRERAMAAADSAMAAEVTKLFQEMTKKEGVTIIMTTHDVGLMDAGDMVIELEHGEQVIHES